jgi:hypothetical protein
MFVLTMKIIAITLVGVFFNVIAGEIVYRIDRGWIEWKRGWAAACGCGGAALGCYWWAVFGCIGP